MALRVGNAGGQLSGTSAGSTHFREVPDSFGPGSGRGLSFRDDG
jgi:hypothetical protein